MAQKKTSEAELLDAIRRLLKSSGHLNKLQAEIRAKITEALKAREEYNGGGIGAAQVAPGAPPDALLVNELVREYLEWNGYLYTASVFASEASLPNERRSRETLCTDVGVRDDHRSSGLPLLANMVAAYTERIKRKITNKVKKS
ncbi:LisH domain-containing protein FOPNL [Eumeta japonica]|uniref:Centrosomal protein 43 n=1 Tax=Eumeta variegata TaxID=151549 RepID=A0A4C1YII0_EUMVA|nr:LisH domain-containing protein FOPNL [Eumeta japonica]